MVARLLLATCCLSGLSGGSVSETRIRMLRNLVLSMLPGLGMASWRDPPVAASEAFSLDGSDWTLTGEGRAFSPRCTGGATAGPDDGCCNFESGVDFTSGSTSSATGVAYAMDQTRCCETCAATAGCAAAVWKGGAPPPPPVPPTPPSTKCNFVKDIDFHPETVLSSRRVSEPS